MPIECIHLFRMLSITTTPEYKVAHKNPGRNTTGCPGWSEALKYAYALRTSNE